MRHLCSYTVFILQKKYEMAIRICCNILLHWKLRKPRQRPNNARRNRNNAALKAEYLLWLWKNIDITYIYTCMYFKFLDANRPPHNGMPRNTACIFLHKSLYDTFTINDIHLLYTVAPIRLISWFKTEHFRKQICNLVWQKEAFYPNNTR